jgi:hypothetical protein
MKISVGHDNWLNLDLGTLNCPQIKFEFSLTEKVKDMSFQEAADYSANLINEKYKNLHLCLSGGLDSEFVADVFVRNKISFKPVIVLTPLNRGEAWYAFRFCKLHNLNPIVLDYSNNIEYDKLLKLIFDISLKIKVAPNVSLIPNVIARLIKDAVLVNGYGDPFSVPSTYTVPIGTIFEIERHDFHLELEYPGKYPAPFFLYTPELFKSLISEIDVLKNIQEAKAELYNLLTRSKIDTIIYHTTVSNELRTMITDRVEKMYYTEMHFSFSKEELLKMFYSSKIQQKDVDKQ